MRHLLLLSALLLVGCRSAGPFEGTGVGHAWDQAVFGADPEYAEGLQFMYETTGETLADRYDSAWRGNIIDPATGQIDLEAANRRARALEQISLEIHQWERLGKAVADYSGVSLTGPADASRKEAMKRAGKLRRAIFEGVKDEVR